MNAKQKERMYQQIEAHGNDLKAIFNLDGDPIQICRKVHMLEGKAHRLTTAYCNGDIKSEAYEKEADAILKAVDKVLNFTAQGIPVFINGDCRGYALKISPQYVQEHNLTIYKDWGGYGIIAPDFDGK